MIYVPTENRFPREKASESPLDSFEIVLNITCYAKRVKFFPKSAETLRCGRLRMLQLFGRGRLFRCHPSERLGVTDGREN
jgi:hypothetical protein